MPHHAAHAGHTLARFVEHYLLAVLDRTAHRLGEVEPVEVLESFDVNTDGVDLRPLGKVGEHVAVGEVGLVAQGQHIARIEPRILAQAGDHEGAALTQHDGVSLRLFLWLRQPLQRNEPGVIRTGMRDHTEAVGAEENRATASLGVGRVDAVGQRGGGFSALAGLAEAAGDQHYRFRRVGFDDVVGQAVDGIGGDRNNQQIELVIQRLQAFDAFDAVDLGLAGTNDGHVLLGVSAAH